MELLYKDGKFVFDCGYNDRSIPKSAGFRWESDKKNWYTTSTKVARNLLEYASTETEEKIKETEEKTKEKIKISFASSTNFCPPVPQDLQYLEYQKAGIEYAIGKKNVLIADEMGLGKTIQAIGVVNSISLTKNVLVVCPASLKLNWKNELQKWLVKSFNINVITSKNKEVQGGINIISYDMTSKVEFKETFDITIYDESHYLKNHKAKRTQKTLAIKSEKKIFLTGTPILNRPIELFTILNNAKIFTNWYQYVTRFCAGRKTRYGWDTSGASNSGELQEILRADFMVRRLKKDVLKDLPAKTRQIIVLENTPKMKKIVNAERAIYKENNQKLNKLKRLLKVAKNDDEYNEISNQIRECQAILFTEMSKKRHETAMQKVPQVLEHIESCLETGVKNLIIFCRHHDVIDELKIGLKDQKISIFTGKNSDIEKQKAVTDFQEGKTNIFIGNINAAGVGITLTSCSHVIFAELDWTPAIISQAEDRVHRIGQKNSVLIQHLVLEDSLDSMLIRSIVRKQKIIDKVLN